MKKLLITSSIIALTALASCSQVVSPNTKDNDITGLETTYQVTCGNKFEEESKKVSSTSEDLKFAFYTDEQLTKRYYDIKFDGLVGSINGGTSADYWVKVTAGGGATGYKEVSKVAKITATCVQSEIGIVPTDCIAEKAFACKYCGAKMSSGGLPMDDSDVVLYDGSKFNYGLLNAHIRVEEDVDPDNPEPFNLGDLVYACKSDKDKTVEVNLPKINFEIYKDKIILIKFRTNNRPGWGTQFAVHIGTDESGENLFDGTLEDGWNVNAESMFILNYSSETNKLTLKVNSKSFKSVTIEDSEIIKGTKNIVVNVKGENRSFAFYNGGVVLDHMHQWNEELISPTDKIGLKIHQCDICKEREYSDVLMDDTDIAANFNAANSFGANAGRWSTSGETLGQAWDGGESVAYKSMIFAHVDYSKFKTVTFEFNTNSNHTYSTGNHLIGLSTTNDADPCDLIPYSQSQTVNLSGTIEVSKVAGQNQLTIVVKEDSVETPLGSATIDVDESVINGSAGLNLFAKLGIWRQFAIDKITVTAE